MKLLPMTKSLSKLLSDSRFRELNEVYFRDLESHIPDHAYVILPCVILLPIIVFVVWKGWKKGFMLSARFLLFELFSLIFYYTVFYRNESLTRRCILTPLWSYEAMEKGKPYLLAENVINIILFIPVGFLFKIGFPKLSGWKVLGIAFFISCSIEVMQYVLNRGLCEVDDVIHNTLGCMAGYGFISLIIYGYDKTIK